MALLIRSARISDPTSAHHQQTKDILIDKGVIAEIKSRIPLANHKVIDLNDLHVTHGWVDMCANFCDPGYEFKEDLQTGLNAAARGGFTGVVSMPTTEPPVDSRAQIDYLLKQSAGHVTELFPAGTVSKKLEGRQLAELHDMRTAGAVAFTDYKRNSSNPELLNRALEYASGFEATVMSFPHDSGINPGGVMNEGPASVSLGLKGIPSMAEEIRLMRDLELARYTGGQLHVLMISTAKSVDLIKQAKKAGIKVTCGVAAHQLSFLDEDLREFDTRLKVLPPFRGEKDRKALIRGLSEGVIDVVVSDHSPEDVENKKREFEHAAYGISSIETAFSSFVSSFEVPDPDMISRVFAANPRKIIGQELPSIAKGVPANLSLFQLNAPNTWSTRKMASKSQNSPFNNTEFSAKVIGVVREKLVKLN